MKTAIIFNGPPSSGKDKLGRILARNLQLPVLQFKDALYELTSEYYKVDSDWLIAGNEAGAESKSAPRPELPDCISIRQALIHVSENIIKPIHGDTYFGKRAVHTIKSLPDAKAYVFTDSGFYPELDEVAKIVDRVVLFRLHRKYCTYDGDSRSYLVNDSAKNLYLLPTNCIDFDIDNNNTINEALWTILEHLCLDVNIGEFNR